MKLHTCSAFAGATLVLAVLVAAIAQAAPTLSPDRDPLLQNMDPTVKPGDDFFAYANGKWIKEHPIPPDEASWSIAKLVQMEIYEQVRDICEAAAAAGAAPGSIEQKLGDYWSAGMDSVSVEKRGLEPIRPELDRIAAIRTPAGVLRETALLHTIGVRPLYSLSVRQDDKNSAVYAVFLWQGGLGLPDRDYYLLEDSTTTRIRNAYPAHIATMFRLMGEDEKTAAETGRALLAVETGLAAGSRTLERLRDPYANYNKMSMAELARLTPHIDWPTQFQLMGVAAVDSVIVGQPEFYSRLDSTLTAVPVDTWKQYLRWCLINAFAERLSSPFDQADFRFYGTLLNGAERQRPRWKRILDATEDGLGELIGQIWVREHCSPATKARYERLTDSVFAAYAERIKQLPWMDPATKAKALDKLSKVNKKVGYPDHWKDFSALTIDRSSYARNQMRINTWWFRFRVGKLGHPVDKTEWDMTPQTYNAYYDGSNVEIVLPAAVFFIPGVPDSLIDDALLYGYGGASTIGHEVTHGFDDEGRQYDAKGNMRPWWTAADSIGFTERTKLLVEQFDQYKIGDRHVRGQATLGENIADLGGVVIGYDAFKKTDQWKRGEKLNGLTPDQRFFLGYALSWVGHARPEALDHQIMTDVHAPRMFRVNGPLSDVPAFYKAFGIRPGDPMCRPEDLQVKIW
jgi:putative endopeptidase